MKRRMRTGFAIAMMAAMVGYTNIQASNPLAMVGSASQENITNKSANWADYVTASINQIKVDESIKLVGLGEATHGNAEFQKLKQKVFEALVKNNGCRVFAIEADFGGAQKVNEYIAGGQGTASEVVYDLGFRIYQTQEMVDLIQWMHDYNQIVPKEKQLKFYGFDMQRYNYNKTYLLEYIKGINPEMASKYETLLAVLNDQEEAKQAQVKEALSHIEALMKEMEQNRKLYEQKSSVQAYDFAYECATCLKENATLDLSGMAYNQLRDGFMKDKVEWIQAYEKGALLFINGHDGHIMKTAKGISYTNMGSKLAEDYKETYYAIGTDFIDAQFNAQTNKGEEMMFSVKNSNALVAPFEALEGNILFMDFKKASKDTQISNILKSKQSMASIGAVFEKLYKMSKTFYTVNVVPEEAYDSIIVVKKATPSTYL